MKVLVTGATGFVGREVLRQLSAAGHGVRILARNPGGAATYLANLTAHPRSSRRSEEPLHSSEFEIIAGDVLKPDSLRGTADGCKAVIHLVGIISEIGKQTFDNVHVRATQNMVAEAGRAGVGRWIHMSALGSRPGARSRYHQTKWAAEEAVRASGLNWTIFRPSIIYGPGDSFVNLFARMTRWSPVLPVMGNGQNKLQPVSVENVAGCFVSALTKPASEGKTFDVCGPDRLSFNAILDTILHVTHRRRLKVHVPMPLARLQAVLLEILFPRLLRQAAPLTRDQLMMLQEDNVGDGQTAAELFRLEMTSFQEGIARYL